jgi:DNA-binding NarL/FixJ family response regulator
MSTSERGPITVFCVDDNARFRGVVRTLIDGTPGLTLIGEAACGEDAIAAVGTLQPDLILMDVRMPGVGGIEATRVLLGSHPDLLVMLMSAEELQPLLVIATSDSRVVFVRKDRLCGRVLLEPWRAGRTLCAPNWVPVWLG